ncbi:MAG: hypothetical protein BMS9Abin09_0167 [Gammaproteobacteria bacterium]|nr:MAG: hypothetical protein BMS9Abin09_0167 [Gammaproteobacteria bacterium]
MSGTTEQAVAVSDRYVCPKCTSALTKRQDAYICTACDRHYPVLHGIADFRLRSDRYLTLEQERDKARRLYEFGLTASFEELVVYYYSITDDVPAELAVRYQAYIRNAPEQAVVTIDGLSPDPARDVLLDLGCGAGGMLVAAEGRYKQVIGVDIALRWLVICKKRLEEQGVTAALVCADAESLPFRGGEITHLVAGDLVEHVYDPGHAMASFSRQLAPGGKLWLSATNRYCIGPHPLTRIWGIGFFPRALRTAILKKIRGVDSLRYINLVSPGYVRQLCLNHGLRKLDSGPRKVQIVDITSYPLQDRVLISLYQGMLKLPLLRRLLLYIGPAFEMTFAKVSPNDGPGGSD